MCTRVVAHGGPHPEQNNPKHVVFLVECSNRSHATVHALQIVPGNTLIPGYTGTGVPECCTKVRMEPPTSQLETPNCSHCWCGTTASSQ
eukprot:3430217-Rhodomonas_salina.1